MVIAPAEPEVETIIVNDTTTIEWFPCTKEKPSYTKPMMMNPTGLLLEYSRNKRGTPLIARSPKAGGHGDVFYDCHAITWSRIGGDSDAFFRSALLDEAMIFSEGAGNIFHFRGKGYALAPPLDSFPLHCELSQEEYKEAVDRISSSHLDKAVMEVRQIILERDMRCKEKKIPAFYLHPMTSLDPYFFEVKDGTADLVTREADGRYYMFRYQNGLYHISQIPGQDPIPAWEMKVIGDAQRRIAEDSSLEVLVTEGNTSKKYERKRFGIAWSYSPKGEEEKAKEIIAKALESVKKVRSHLKVWEAL